MIISSNTYDITTPMGKFPRSKEKLENWISNILYNQELIKAKADGGENEFKETWERNKEQIKNGIYPHFTYHGRDLYEFFDENEVYIEPYEYQGQFGVDVSGNEMNGYSSRWEMEKAAFDKAFEVLEAKF